MSLHIRLWTAHETSLRFRLYKEPPEKLEEKKIYSQGSFDRLQIEDAGIIRGRKVNLFINGQHVKTYQEGALLYFERDNYRLFQDYFGTVRIRLEFSSWDGKTETFTSAYIPILVEQKELRKDVLKMLEVVEQNYHFLYDEDVNSLYQNSLKKGSKSVLETKITLATEILELYEGSFELFRNGAQFAMHSKRRVDHLEKARRIDGRSVRYAATHPQYLVAASGGAILFDKQNYLPSHIEFPKNEITYDIYENRVLVDFLKRISVELDEYAQELKNQEKVNIPEREEGRIVSAFYLLNPQSDRKIKRLEKLEIIQKRIDIVQAQYGRLFGLRPRDLKTIPEKTYIFQRDQLYQRFFHKIIEWFNIGKSDLKREEINFSLSSISSLYENYVLIRLIKELQSTGFKLKNGFRHIYDVDRDSFYSNTLIKNTFIFNNSKGKEFTLYYQPVIFDRPVMNSNGIQIYRNRVPEWALDSQTWYYTPDFLIKYVSKKGNIYFLLDAKYSGLEALENREEMKNSLFKYILSISPIDSRNQIRGLSLVYGKSSADERISNFYNRARGEIIPFAVYIPVDQLEVFLKTLSELL